MRPNIYLIVLLFLCAVFTSCCHDCEETKCYEEYIVTLDMGFGQIEQSYYKYEETVTIPKLDDKEWYWFLGWSTTKDGEPIFTSLTFDITSDVKPDIKYYAVWGKVYDVFLDDLYSYSKNRIFTVREGSMLNLSDIFPLADLQPYYVFKGWSTDGREEHIISEILVDKADIVLYAVWEQKIFRIYFDLNGGTGIELPKIEVKKGDYLSYSSLPTSGFSYGVYTFEGWSETKNGKVITSDFKPDKDMTLYAVWSHNGQVKDKTDDN